MEDHLQAKALAAKADSLHSIAKELLLESEEFPAVNRNVKRILASVEMLRLNLEMTEPPSTISRH
jgi:hypothetical protein